MLVGYAGRLPEAFANAAWKAGEATKLTNFIASGFVVLALTAKPAFAAPGIQVCDGLFVAGGSGNILYVGFGFACRSGANAHEPWTTPAACPFATRGSEAL